MAKTALNRELNALKEDADKIMSDIGAITKTLGAIGKEGTQKVADDMAKNAEDELKILKARLVEVEKRSKVLAAMLDKQVRQNPYLFLLGFLGLGFLLGKLSSSGKH